MSLAARIIQSGIGLKVDGDQLRVRGALTDEQRAFLRQNKAQLVAELIESREHRRSRVLADLETNTALKYSWLQTTAEDGSTILTVAVRGAGSAELTVEGQFDPFQFLEMTSP